MSKKLFKWSIFVHLLILVFWVSAIINVGGSVGEMLGRGAQIVGLLLVPVTVVFSIVIATKQKVTLLPILLSLVPVINSLILLGVMFVYCIGARCIPIAELAAFWGSLIGFGLSVIVILIVKAILAIRKRDKTGGGDLTVYG